jgi:amino acid transporter
MVVVVATTVSYLLSVGGALFYFLSSWDHDRVFLDFKPSSVIGH